MLSLFYILNIVLLYATIWDFEFENIILKAEFHCYTDQISHNTRTLDSSKYM